MGRSRSVYVGGLLPDPEPEPAYPEYEELRAEAECTCPRFSNPADIYRLQEIQTRRGYDWRVAVLGRAGGRLSVLDAHMLKLADQRGLNPPLPPSIVAARQAFREREEQAAAQRQAFRDRDRKVWEDARAQCAVPVTVRPNLRGRHLVGGYDDGPLRHAVPEVDALSGRSRKHLKGRPLCETANRPKPRELGEETDEPVTCKGCLSHLPRIRPVETKEDA